MATATDEILKHSVTKDETEYYRAANIFLPLFHYSQPVGMLPELDGVSSLTKDAILTSTLKSERKWWPSGVHTTISQVASTSWQVKGEPEVRARRGQELLHTANGGHGYIEFVARVILDFLTTNNGCFIEKIYATSASASKLLGLMHLSSHRCRRTGNPEAPVVYTDVLGQEHEMKAHQVIFTSDLSGYGDGMGGFGANTQGIGMCAAERCYDAIRLQQAIEGFIYGRITGTKTNALDFVQGIMPQQIQAAVASAEADRLMKGNIYYKGVTLIASAGEQKLEHLRVNFAEMPNGFDRETETKLNLMSMALALGLDFQDLYPQALPGGMNTSSQSQKLGDAARGKGLAMFCKWLAWVITEMLATNTTFTLSERDYRDEEIQANVAKTRTDVVSAQVDKQIITPAEAKQILVDQNVLPPWVQQQDLTASETLDDTEKPRVGEDAQLPAVAGQEQPATTVPATPQVVDDNVIDAEVDDPEEEEPTVATVKAATHNPATTPHVTGASASTTTGVKAPGSRGGKYWIDPTTGKPRYDDPPEGVKPLTAAQHKALTRRLARAETSQAKSRKALIAKGWQVKDGSTDADPEGFGADKTAALAEATAQAKLDKSVMYVVLRIGGNYVIASKPISDLKEEPAKPEAAPAQDDNLVTKAFEGLDIPALVDGELETARKLFGEIVNRDKEREGGHTSQAQDRQVKEYGSITTKEAAEAAIAGGVRLPVHVLRAWPGLDMNRRRELRKESKVA